MFSWTAYVQRYFLYYVLAYNASYGACTAYSDHCCKALCTHLYHVHETTNQHNLLKMLTHPNSCPYVSLLNHYI